MGIDIGNKLMLVPTEQDLLHSAIQLVADEKFDGDFWTAMDDLGLDYASPWYDASMSNCDIGVSMPTPTYDDLMDQNSKWYDALQAAKDKLDIILDESVDTKLDSFQHVY